MSKEQENITITLNGQQIDALHTAMTERAWNISKRSRPEDIEEMDILVQLERTLKPSIGEFEGPLTIDDLDKIIIAPGVTARSATDRQFFDWADPLVAFEISDGPEDPWPLQHRANLCNMFYRMGVIKL